MASGTENDDDSNDIDLILGSDELVIRNRYEVARILNELFIGVLFVVGSILFLWQSTSTVGTWLFILGSSQLLLKPGIGLARRVHLKRFDSPHDRVEDADW